MEQKQDSGELAQLRSQFYATRVVLGGEYKELLLTIFLGMDQLRYMSQVLQVRHLNFKENDGMLKYVHQNLLHINANIK